MALIRKDQPGQSLGVIQLLATTQNFTIPMPPRQLLDRPVTLLLRMTFPPVRLALPTPLLIGATTLRHAFLPSLSPVSNFS